jgi:hypothetical protein
MIVADLGPTFTAYGPPTTFPAGLSCAKTGFGPGPSAQAAIHAIAGTDKANSTLGVMVIRFMF